MKLDIQLFADDAEVSIKFNNKITGEKKLEKYKTTLTQINSILNGLNLGTVKQLESSAGEIGSIDKNVSSISKKVGTAFNFMAVSKYASAIKKLGSVVSSLSKQSFDYLENFNLFQVAFNGNYNSAERFINKMSEMYGLDESWLTQTVGKFKQLSNAMNITAETGEKVSKLLTQMSLDISSLYNVDIERAASTLSSAMAGQTKPIRGVAGGDITQATLQTTLDQLKIDETVNKLSFAEKRLLIIISLTRQLNASIGDMGRTIESPSNQLRIMNEQWERLTRAVGNVFLPILTKILPYLNAILMVLTEIISTIATLLGYSSEDFDYFDSSATGAWDLSDGLGSAATNAKKLKQGLRGFDKLNVITTPNAGGSSGGVGGAGTGGINPKLMAAFNDAFDDYQKRLDDVEMKATRIRDKILEWLGFTKNVDSVTGDVSFKYTGINNRLTKIFDLIVNSSPAIKGLIKGTKTLVSAIKFFTTPSATKNNILEELTEKTAARLKPVQTAFDNLKKTISTISYDGLALTKEEKKKIIDSINDLTASLQTALDDYVNSQIENLNLLYKETGVISEEEYNKRLKDLDKFHKEEQENINHEGETLKKKYKDIYDKNGNIIIEKYADYLDELDKYENNSYQKLASGESDKNKLLNVKLDESKENQVQYYSDLLQAYAKDRDDAIKKAEEKRDKTVKAAEEQYGRTSVEYGKIKKKAEETYDSEVKTAQESYNDIYNAFDESQKDISRYIDKDTGKVKSKWSKFIGDLKSAFKGDLKLKVTYDTNASGIKKSVADALGLKGWPTIKLGSYAQGGLPPVGQLFVANEKGPELVGQIGGQSFVANQNQILDFIGKNAGSNFQPINATFVIQVGNRELAKQVINDLQDMAKTNGKPITING